MQPKASVLIPVKNGGELFAEVLDAVLAQKTPWPFEVLVVDSGSSDRSLEIAKKRNVPTFSIAPIEFGHGRTRNHLGKLSQGEFLVFITQDAKPASDAWLKNLVEACDSAPNVAGAFGPHQAHPGARLITQRELSEHFSGFGKELSLVQIEDQERFDREVGYRQWLHFFSNNNSCLRRSVWEKIPFPDVMFAEDQTWMLSVVKAGFSKAFAPNAVVYHSHDFGVWETLQRNFDEASSFRRDFGYTVQPHLLRALLTALALTRRDVRWLREAGSVGGSLAKNSMYMLFIEFARTIGQYLGTNYQILPHRLLSFFSRDQSLQKKY